MNRLKYLIIGILALIMAGCGQTVVETLNVLKELDRMLPVQEKV